MTELSDINIRHLKLSTGEELISIVLDQQELVDSEDQSSVELMVLQRPMKIHTVEKDDMMSFLFYEWQPLSKSDICYLNPMHVVSHVECDDQVKGQYINVCVNGDSILPSEPSDDIESELDDMMVENVSTSGPTYH